MTYRYVCVCTGVVTSFAGASAGFVNYYGYQDGLGSLASFNGPEGVCADVNGNVYVADSGNNVVRRICPGVNEFSSLEAIAKMWSHICVHIDRVVGDSAGDNCTAFDVSIIDAIVRSEFESVTESLIGSCTDSYVR